MSENKMALIARKKQVARKPNGQFAKGTSGNPRGRPTKEREEKYYKIAMTAVTYKDWRSIIKMAAQQAIDGDAQARKWLSEYLAPQSQRHELSGGDPAMSRHIDEFNRIAQLVYGDPEEEEK